MCMKKLIMMILASVFIQGCITAGEHRKAVQDDSSDRITVGKVKRAVSIGMSGAKVAQVLGSPNFIKVFSKTFKRQSLLELIDNFITFNFYIYE